jgi:hypothetical protein
MIRCPLHARQLQHQKHRPAIQTTYLSTDTARRTDRNSPRLRAPIEVDRQEGHIGGRDPADAKGLPRLRGVNVLNFCFASLRRPITFE